MYVKTKWEDRVVEFPNRYKIEKEKNSEYYLLTQKQGEVAKEGTFVKASIMNNIEDGIYNNQLFSFETTLLVENWVLNETTNLYEYNVTREDITENVSVDGVMDLVNQEKLGNGYTKSYDGGFKIYTSDLPSENIDITFKYQLANMVLGGTENVG